MKIAAAAAFAAAALALAVLSPQSARAQVAQGDKFFTVDLGAGLPYGKVDSPGLPSEKLADPGFMGGVQYIYQLSPNFGLGGDVYYSLFNTHKAHSCVPFLNQTMTFTMRKTTFELTGRWVFMPQAPYYPYLVGGVGVNNIYYQARLQPSAVGVFPLGGKFTDTSFTTPSFSAGLGFEGALTESFLAGFEARWRYLGTYSLSSFSGSNPLGFGPPFYTTSDEYSFGPASEVTLAIRLGWKFKAGS